MKKRIIAICLVMVLVLSTAFSTIAFAFEDVEPKSSITLSAYVNSTRSGSDHQVTAPSGTYPIAEGKLYYLNSSGKQRTKTSSGSSYSSYWTASISIATNELACGAKTTYSGASVTDGITW